MSVFIDRIVRAIKDGDVVWVRKIIEQGADVNEMYNVDGSDKTCPEVCSLLHVALSVRSLPSAEIVKTLIDAGANVNAIDGECKTPLHYASRGFNPQQHALIKMLLQAGAGVNAKTIFGRSPLSMAGVECDLCGIVELVYAGADVNAKDAFGDTTLHHLCKRSGTRDVCESDIHVDNTINTIRFLIDHGADMFATNNNGISPMQSVDTEDEELIKFLESYTKQRTQHKDCVDKTKLHEQLPFFMAIEQGDLSAVKQLMSHGADIHTPFVGNYGIHGLTPLHIAIRSSKRLSVNIAEKLIASGADVSAITPSGRNMVALALDNTDECLRNQKVHLLVDNRE